MSRFAKLALLLFCRDVSCDGITVDASTNMQNQMEQNVSYFWLDVLLCIVLLLIVSPIAERRTFDFQLYACIQLIGLFFVSHTKNGFYIMNNIITPIFEVIHWIPAVCAVFYCSEKYWKFYLTTLVAVMQRNIRNCRNEMHISCLVLVSLITVNAYIISMGIIMYLWSFLFHSILFPIICGVFLVGYTFIGQCATFIFVCFALVAGIPIICSYFLYILVHALI